MKNHGKGNDTFWLTPCIGHCIEVYSEILESNDCINVRTYRTTNKGTEQIKKILVKYDNQIVAYRIDIDCVCDLREQKLKRILNIK